MTEKELLSILTSGMSNVDGFECKEICYSGENLKDIAKQIISKLPKIIEIGRIKNFHKCSAKVYLCGENFIYSRVLDDNEHRIIAEKIGRGNKNMKIYVEVLNE